MKKIMDAIKNFLKKIPLVRYTHAQVRKWQDKNEGKRLFENYDLYLHALEHKEKGTVNLRTHDGLIITIRQNIWDARIVREIFMAKPYLQHITLPPSPVIIDIGGYIGDFSIYAAKYLNAAQVIVYEPTTENFEILKQNIANNDYADRITAVNKAVSDSHQVILNVQIQESEEVHVSAYWYQEAEQRSIPSVTLAEIFEVHQLDSIDLLKVDCEGGEYDIFPAVPDHIFKRIRNIVFEYHHVDDFEAKLDRILNRLQAAGYVLHKGKNIIAATP